MSSPYTLPTVTLAARETLTVVHLPSSAPMDERTMACAGLLSCLRRVPKSDQDTVQLVLSLLATTVPEVAQVLSSATSSNIRTTSIDLTRYLDLINADGGGRPDRQLLPVPEAASGEALLVTSVPAVFSGVALVLFAIGKQARESAPTAAAVNRPSALIRKYTLTDQEQILLPGRDLGPAVKTLERIYNAFNVYSELRALVAKSLLAINAATPHPPAHLDPLMVQLHLLRNSGMTHVGAIEKLVQAHPWVVRVPELEPYFRRFCFDLVEFEKIPKAVRQYHRLLAPPNDFLFLTSELRPLIAVAGDFVKDVEIDFKDYVYNADKFEDLIKKVRSYQPMYVPTSNLQSLAAQLGLDDIPLLPEPAKATTPLIVPAI